MSTLAPPVAYFSAIGMGFMLIEISQMQRLMVFLGHPVYGLSVVLFTILLFSGIGSATVGARGPRSARSSQGRRTPDHARGGRAAYAVGHRLGAVGSNRHAHSGVGPAAGAAGILHGDDVPARALDLAPSRDLLPFFWSTNGITSMLASVLGMALSIQFGIARTYALGACFYVVCAIIIIASRQAKATLTRAAKRPWGRGWCPRIRRLRDPLAGATASIIPLSQGMTGYEKLSRRMLTSSRRSGCRTSSTRRSAPSRRPGRARRAQALRPARRHRRLERRAAGGLLGFGASALVFGTAASWRGAGSVRLASITFGFAGGGGARGGVCRAAEADLAGEAGEEAVRLRVRRRIGDPRRSQRAGVGRRCSELGFFRRAEQQIVGGRARRIDVGRDGAGRARQREQRQALAIAAFGEAGIAVGHAGGEYLVHAAVDAGVGSRDRRAL